MRASANDRKIPDFPPEMVAEQARKEAVGRRGNVIFGCVAGVRLERQVPQGREQQAVAVVARAVGAFASGKTLLAKSRPIEVTSMPDGSLGSWSLR
jgi:hypothetical protein